jgi:hypothetical protein
MQWLNSGRFQKKPSASAANNGRTDAAILCVHVCVCVCARACVRACVHTCCFEGD